MKVTKEKLMSEIRAYLLITFGLLIYTFAVTAFWLRIVWSVVE